MTRRVITENGINGRQIKTRRVRLKIKATDLAVMMQISTESLMRVENCMPYVPTRSVLVHADEVLHQFENATMAELLDTVARHERFDGAFFAMDEKEYGEKLANLKRRSVQAERRIVEKLKFIKEPPMGEQLYVITFEDGTTQQEYGQSESDVRDFISRCFAFKCPIRSVELYEPPAE
jgi:hypothetical protein